MKRAIMPLISFMITYPIGGVAAGFKIDLSTMEAVKQFNVLNVGSLAIGEKGLVSIHGLDACVDNGELQVASTTMLDTEPSKYSYSYEVIRHPNNQVSARLSNKGKKPGADAVQQAVFSILSLPDCMEARKRGIPLFSVTRFLGTHSLRELVSQSIINVEKNTIDNNLNEGSSELPEVLNNWIVSESKSPIDDSPSVTMMKIAESGDQTLILRCKENTTDAYINTDDFLGDNSTNVTVRFDNQKARKQQLSLSTNDRALFFSPAIGNIKMMMKSQNMVIRYHTYNGTPKTVTFQLNGLKEKITPLRAACHW